MFDFKRNASILLLALIGTAGIAGCGGDDDPDPTPAPVETTTTDSPTLTQDELINEGDGYCSEVNAAVGTINASTTADESVKEEQIAGIYSGLAERLEDLGTPTEGDAPTEVIEAAQALAESDSTTAASALSTFQSAADAYGFTECGEAPVAPSSSSSTVPSDPGASGDSYVEPTPAPVEPAPAPVEPAPPAGGGVAPGVPADPGTGGGGSSSGGISPG